MNRRSFIKSGALFVPVTFGIFVPRLRCPAPVVVNSYRFGSAWTPATPGNLLRSVYADNISPQTDGNSVATWADESGLGKDFTQATAGSKPTLKTNIVSGHSVVRFDGTDDFLFSDTLTPSQMTILMVAKTTAAATTQQILIQWGYLGVSSNNLCHFWLTGSKYTCHFRDNTSSDIATAQSGTTDTAFHALAAVFDNPERFYDGTMAGTTPATSGTLNTSATKLGLGVKVTTSGGAAVSETNYFSGDIAELHVYSVALSAGHLASWAAYATAKYGTP